MTKGLKRILSMVIAIVMVVGMVPTNALHVHAADTDYTHHPDKLNGLPNTVVVNANNSTQPTTDSAGNAIYIPVGSEWVNPEKVGIADGAKCLVGKIQHSHTDDCYDKELSCGHSHTADDCYTDEVECAGTKWVQTGKYPWQGEFQACTDHQYHWSEGSGLSTKLYGANTLSCSHSHIAFGETNSCYVNADEPSALRCPTCSLTENWTPYTHSHTETACYQYTWTVAWKTYDVTVTVSGKDGVTASNLSATTVTHGRDVSFALPAMGDIGWVATIEGGAQTTTVELSATEVTTVTVEGATTGNIQVTLSQKTIYDVSLTNTTPDYGTASVNVAKGVDGTTVTVTATPKDGNVNTKYKLDSIVVNGTPISGNTFQINGANASVEVTFSKTYLKKSDSIGNVEFYHSTDASAQLEGLKAAIFTAVVNTGASIPNTITANDVEIHYYQYHDAGIGEDGFNAGMKLLGEAAQADDTTMNPHTYYDFGERFANGGDATEKVRITGKSGTSWAGLYVETEITLKHDHQETTVDTAATCETGAYTTYTCTTCGNVRKVDTSDALGHSYVDHAAKAPTCTEIGYNAYQTCSRVGCTYSTYVEIPATNHQDTLVQVGAQAPDCDSIGWDAYEYCTACDHTTYVEKPALNHSYGEWYTVQGSTSCTGSTERRDCQNVGCSHYETKDGNGSGHTMGEWNVTTPASCGQAGEERRDCANCDYFETQAITALTHDIKTVEAKSPTCTEIGWDAYEYCDRKDCDHTTYVEKAKLGHGHTAGYRNDNKQNGTHDVFCLDCNTVTNNVPHAFNAEHKCVCGAVETFTITFKNWNGEELWSGAVAYGTVPTAPAVTAPANHTFIGWDSTVAAVSGPKTYTAKIELNANNGDLPVNTSVEDAAEHLVGLKSKVLKAAGLPENGNYTVTTVVNIDLGLGAVDVTLRIDENGVVVNGDWSYLQSVADRLAPAALANDLNGQATKAFSITDNATGVSKTVTHKIVDTRLAATVDELTKKDFGSFDTQSEFETAVKNAITASWTNREGVSGKVAADKIKVNFSNPVVTVVDGKTVKTYSVTVSVSEGTNWLASAESVTFAGLYWTVNQYQITWVDGNGDELKSEMLDYGAAPSYTGATPTKTATAQYTYTFNNTWSPAVASVSGAATYTAQFDATVNKYTVTWLDGDGKVIYTEQVAYGDTPAYDKVTYGDPTKSSDDPETVWTWNTGWETEIVAVTGDVSYKATFTKDTIFIVTFNNNGTLTYGYVNDTKGETKLSEVNDPADIDGFIFGGWFNGQTEFTQDTVVTGNITVTAKWIAESNNNNVLDEEETVKVEIPTGGSITFNGSAPVNGEFIYDSKNNSYTIVITPPANHYVESVEIAGVNFAARNGSVSYNNGVMTISSVSLTDGDVIKATFVERKIPAIENPAIEVNGESADTKLQDVTKKSVLEAVLGREVTNAELAQYEVKVMVNANFGIYSYNGYYDIWALIGQFSGKDDTISQTALSALKGAFNTAIDVGGSETFEITWLAQDKYPSVKGEYSVKLTEKRQPTTVTHQDGITYTATALNDALLEKIKANLTSNATISTLSYVDPTQILTPGTTVDVQVIVNVLETDALYGASHTITVKVEVPASDIDIKIPTTATIYFNTSMSNTDKVALLKDKVPYTSYVIGTDILATDVVEKSFKIQYLASTARTVPYTINIKQLDLGLAGNFLPDTIEVQIPVDAMWLDMATMGNDFPVYEAPSNELIRDILLNDLIPNYADDYLSGSLDTEALKAKAAELLAKHPDIANYYKYMGAHQFGELGSETIRYVVDTQFGAKETNECVLSMVDERAETEIKLNSGVEVTYNGYTEAELLALILDGVYTNGQKIDGLTVQFVTDVSGLPAADASEVTVKFAGNKDYKPSEATIAIKINKATVNVSVDNRLFKWQSGKFYTISDVVSTNPAGVQIINFIAGLNISDVNLNDGLKGFVAQVQLMLPEELQSLLTSADDMLKAAGLDVSFADGASMKLSDLKAAVDALDDLFAGSEYEEYFRVLLNMLSSLPTETADIEIIIGGDVPTDIGAYVVGAISADANYTTDFGVGAIAIYPDGTKVDIAWNQNDDNYVITNTLLSSGAFDTGAHAIKVYDDRYTLDEATAQVGEIFLGVDIDGNITLEMDQTKLNVGAYIEIAMIVNFGNEMFYSEPLVRPVVVVAETLNVDFVDASGAVNNERHYEFFNIPQNGMEGNLLVTYKKDGNGYKAGDKVSDYNVKYFYVGVQTNGVPYASQEAPVHAGVYTITAMVTVRDNTGYITHAGQGIGALVIEPSKSTIDVENEAIKWDGNEHTFNQYVTAGSVNVPTIPPDTTVITAGINADLDANIGLSAINGTVNVDMPIWLDNLMKKLGILEAGYADGITVTEFKAYVEKIKTGLAELGFDSEAFDKIVSVIDQLDGNVVLTFHDNKGYKEVGVYLVIGIVTDSDHYPSADAGLVVIYPDATKVELQFNETWDDNNVFTWAYLQSYDLNAKAYQPGTNTEIPAATDKVINLFVGFADHGELEFTSNKTELDNGVYAQVAFVLDLSNEPYYAEPIAREVIIVPNNADIDFVDEDGKVNNDRHFGFNNQPHAMNTIRVTLVDGTVLNLTVEDSRVAIFYVGVQSNGQPYASYDAPVNTGVYEVTAQYTERDAQGRVIHLGVGIGALVIEASKSNVSVDNDAFPYGEAHKVNGLVHASSVNVPGLTPDTTVISVGLSANLDNITGLNAINGTVNIDLPAWMDSVMNKLNILDAGYANGISAEVFLSYADKIRNGMDELGVDTVAFDKIVSLVKQLPISTNLTFTDDIAYSEIGAYLVIAVVTDFNHYPSVGAGVMVIYPNATKVDLKFNEDWNDNNIFTWHALKSMDLEAKAYLNGAYCEAADKKVVNLYFGFTDDGQFMLDAVTYGESIKDVPEFRNGMYTQLALVQDLGNEMYYAKPISRAFVIVPTPAIIEFVDGNGNVNADRHFVFNNKPQGMDVRVTIAGVEQTDLSGLTITYVGIQTNGVKYNSTVAPTHSGAYVVTATMTARDSQGRLVTLGVAVGAMVIEPAKSTVTVDSKLHEFNNTGVSTDAMIHTGSAVAGISPDKTVITTSITSEGLQAIKGEVNVDFPAWVDTILNQDAPSIYGAGIPVGEFSEKVVAKLNKAVADAEALAEEYDIPADKLIATLTAAIAEVEKIVDQLPTGVILTFKEQSEVAPKEVGAYLVVAVVTDSDHYPSMDAGVLVIYPNVSKAELKWFYNDTNGIFTLPALKSIDMTANGYVGGVEDEAVTATIAYLTVGIDENGKLIVTSNPNSLTSNGAYTEVAYIPVKVGAEMTVAAPIMRSFVVVPQTVTVTVTDTESIFNEDYQLPVSVVDMNKQAITGERLEKYLELTYIGINASAGLYHSNVKPTSVGVYAVIATYIEKDANGEYTYVGMNVGKLTIKAASASVDVENEIHVFNDKKFDVTELITKNPADAKLAVITAALNLDGDFSKSGILATGTSVNIDFPTRVDEVLQKVLGDAYTNGIKLNPFFQKLDDISAELVEIGVDAKAVSYLKKQLEQLPSNTVLTFKDQVEVNPSAIGVYTIGAVVMDPDYQFAADTGLLVITNDITLAELKWNYRDTNSIITRAVLAELDMAASAYVKDAYNEENTNRISYMVFGAGSDGSISLISDPAAIKNLPNGVYTEVAYIYQEIDATMTLAIPVVRTFTIVEHNVDVIFEDVEAIYNGQPHGVDVILKDLNLNVIDDPKNLTVTYINLGTNYYSTTAPTEVGSYTVVVKYEKYINGDRAFFGMEVGNVTIKSADADYILSDKTVECGEISAINGMITNTNNLPYAIYIIKNAAKGEVNVILPAGWKVTLPVGAGVDALIAEIEKLPAVIENTKLISTLKSVLNSIDMQKLTVNGAQPSTCGEYDITAIAFGNKNYNIAKASATLTIEHADEEIIPGKNASCTDTGLTEGKKCAVCGDILVAQEVISATDHDWSVTYTWSADGKTCTATHVCGNNAAHNETVSAVITSKQTKDPTCTEKGETTYTATFEVAWATKQTKTVADVPATDHDWSVSYSWSADGKTCTATHVCGNNAAHNETATATVTSKVTDDPTCTEKGETTYTATFTEAWATTQTKVLKDVPATDHAWSVTYTWSADGKTCTATHVCGNNAAHNETATATVTSKVTDDPTCTEKGETTYTATFTEAWATTQTKVLKDVPATDHAWSVTYTWSADGKTCTATHVCGNNAVHNETATATVTSKVTDDPTCTEKGETTYTATFTEAWATTQTKVLKDVPATDHDWSVSYSWSADGKTCTATHVCGNNAAHNETATATVTSKVTDDPTCTEKGETTYIATFTEAWATTQTKVLKDVPATDHDWSVSYSWSADGKTCTATRTCAHSDDCEQTAAATVTSAVKTGAGCETKGTTTYTATFTADWATKQTKDVQDIPATGHIDINEDQKCDNCGISMGQIKDPVIGIPVLSGDNIYGFAVDYENKRIYIDTVKTGLTIDQFVEQLEVLLSNDADNKAEIVVSYQNKALTGTELIRTEAQVSLTAENDNGKITVKYDVVVIGDVNRNGEVDSGDASLIQRYFFKEVELTDLQADAADTNRSGEIESGDAVKNQVKYNDAANYQSNLHSYTEGISNGDATCEKDGTMTLKCTANHNCGAKFITVPEAGSAKGHKYVLKEDVYVCEVCGKKQTPNV